MKVWHLSFLTHFFRSPYLKNSLRYIRLKSGTRLVYGSIFLHLYWRLRISFQKVVKIIRFWPLQVGCNFHCDRCWTLKRLSKILFWEKQIDLVFGLLNIFQEIQMKMVIPTSGLRAKHSFFWPSEANMRFLTMILGRKGVQMTLSKFPISNFTGGQHAVNRRWPKSPKSWKNAISSKSIFCWKWLKQLLNWY